MIKPIAITQADATLNDAVHIMRQKRVDTIFVVDSNNHLLGFLDIEDINQGIRGHKSFRHHATTYLYRQIDSKLQDYCTYDLKENVRNVPVVIIATLRQADTLPMLLTLCVTRLGAIVRMQCKQNMSEKHVSYQNIMSKLIMSKYVT